MKYTLILLLLPVFSLAQIPVKSNAIKVNGVGFMEACTRLLDMGYLIDKKDNDLMTAQTTYKHYVNSYNAEHKIFIRVVDSVLTVSGLCRAPAGTGGLLNDEKLWWAKAKKSLASVGFSYLDAYALSFGKPVEYLKQ